MELGCGSALANNILPWMVWGHPLATHPAGLAMRESVVWPPRKISGTVDPQCREKGLTGVLETTVAEPRYPKCRERASLTSTLGTPRGRAGIWRADQGPLRTETHQTGTSEQGSPEQRPPYRRPLHQKFP